MNDFNDYNLFNTLLLYGYNIWIPLLIQIWMGWRWRGFFFIPNVQTFVTQKIDSYFNTFMTKGQFLGCKVYIIHSTIFRTLFPINSSYICVRILEIFHPSFSSIPLSFSSDFLQEIFFGSESDGIYCWWWCEDIYERRQENWEKMTMEVEKWHRGIKSGLERRKMTLEKKPGTQIEMKWIEGKTGPHIVCTHCP